MQARVRQPGSAARLAGRGATGAHVHVSVQPAVRSHCTDWHSTAHPGQRQVGLPRGAAHPAPGSVPLPAALHLNLNHEQLYSNCHATMGQICFVQLCPHQP